jgi:hypothetical protein
LPARQQLTPEALGREELATVSHRFNGVGVFSFLSLFIFLFFWLFFYAFSWAGSALLVCSLYRFFIACLFSSLEGG